MVGCATRTPITDSLTSGTDITNSYRIRGVPVFEQDEKQCGPASLATIFNYYGITKTPEELSRFLFTKKLGGSFRSDILASARNEGFMAMEMNDLSLVLKEVSEGNPVIIFQNLGLASMPQWHFSVLTGYDLKGPDVFLHSGKIKEEKMDMRLFERSWSLGGNWAALIMPPDKTSSTMSELSHIEAATLLESLANHEAALKAYRAILSRWPQSHLASIGAANVSYAINKKSDAEKYLLLAVESNSRSAIAWHNLALIQGELGKHKEARSNARKALTYVEKDKESNFRISLKNFL